MEKIERWFAVRYVSYQWTECVTLHDIAAELSSYL